MNRRRITYEQVRNRVQASDQELNDGLRKAHVITVDGSLLPVHTSSSIQTTLTPASNHALNFSTLMNQGVLRKLSMSQLSSLLQKILNTMVAEGLSTFVPLADLHKALLKEHGVQYEMTDQVVKWFGLCEGGLWEPDFEQISKVIGLSLLSENKVWHFQTMQCWL